MRSVGAEVTGWSAALVLALGVGTALTGAVDDPRPAVVLEQADTPVVESVDPAALPRAKGAVPAAAPAGPVDELLGPPPGPFDDLEPAARAAPADRYALLVGVQDYRSPTKDTIGSVADVRLIQQELLRAGWLPQNVRVLTDASATGAAVREGMAWLAARGVPGTFSLFHYSGHVKQLGGGTEALWPVDRDFVRDTEVTAALSRVTGRMWVDVAGCEAGSFLPGLPSDRVLVTTSSTATQKSYEYPVWGTSIWTGLLFGQAPTQADADGDGTVVVGEALRWSRYYAQLMTKAQRPHGRQTPQLEGDPVRGWTLDSPPA